MHVLFELEHRGPLRVIPEIPNHPLVLIEGYNGAGKSLAFRVLQLLTGQMPYRLDSAAWFSLVAGLGSGRVEVSELPDGARIEWIFDSLHWQDRSLPVTTDWFSSIRINGEPATLSDVVSRLEVQRIAGDETLIETFALQAEVHAATVDAFAASLTAEDGALARTEGLASRLRRRLAGVDLAQLDADRGQLQETEHRLSSLTASVEALQARIDGLTNALEVRAALRDIAEVAPNLDAQLAEIEATIQQTQQRRLELEQEIHRVTQKAAFSTNVLHQLENARRTRDRHSKSLQQAVDALAVASRSLDVPPERNAIGATLAETTESIASLEARKRHADAAPSVRDLLDKVTPSLSAAESVGLGQEEFLEFPERSYTLEETRVAAQARRTTLESVPQQPEAEALGEQLIYMRRRQAQLLELPDLLDAVARFRRLTRQQEDRIRELTESGAVQASQQLASLEKERSGLDNQLVELAGTRGDLRQRRGRIAGGESEAVLRNRFQEVLRQIGVDARSLDLLNAEAQSERERLAGELQLTAAQADELRLRIRGQYAEAARVVEAISEASEWAWLRALSDVWVMPGQSDYEKVQRVSALQARANDAAERLGDLRIQLVQISEALRGISRDLRGQEIAAKEYVPELQRWLSLEFSTWFNNPRILEQLLPGARDAEVDLPTREIRWKTTESPRARPIEAFSSGEQAFAYTRARLGLLDDSVVDPRRTRLVVLDEFGAFIAQDGLAKLFGYLRERVLVHPHDQVVIVLPVREDYATLANNAAGSERARLERLAEELAANSYLAQDLST